MRHSFRVLLALAILDIPAWGISIEVQDCGIQIGIRLDTDQLKVELAEGQTIEATVVNATTLARHGLKGLKKGEKMKLTYISGYRFKLMCVPSGRSVEITYRPKSPFGCRASEGK